MNCKITSDLKKHRHALQSTAVFVNRNIKKYFTIGENRNSFYTLFSVDTWHLHQWMSWHIKEKNKVIILIV